jgi:S1-C subfamily serine protease
MPVSVSGIGSGVLVSSDGKVLTAAHVVQTAEKIQVRFQGGQKVDARVLGTEPAADIALLQVDRVPSDAVVAKVGDSDDAQVGDPVFVVGAPFGASHTLTVGHLSARRKPDKVVSGFETFEVLQTDAAINPGNSGGPLFDMNGEVIGIASYIISKSGGFQGLGFAVSSNMARKLLLEGRPMWSGLEGEMLEGTLARLLNLPQEAGILVLKVAKDSPAAKLGLKGGFVTVTLPDGQELVLGGDVVLEVQGIRISDM